MKSYIIYLVLIIKYVSSNPIDSTTEESHKEKDFQLNTKIYVCGNRIREVIRYICPKESKQGYYTPGVTQEQKHTLDHTRHHHNYQRHSRRKVPGFLPRRLRRQIVKECCNQPCYEKNLLKYCSEISYEIPSTEISIVEPVTERNSANQLRKNWNSGFRFIPMVYIPYELGGDKNTGASALTNKFSNPDWLWGRHLRSVNDETQEWRHNSGSWAYGMQVITEAPHPEPVVILPDDIMNFYN